MPKILSQKISDEIIIYQSEDGEISFNVNVFEETVWLSQSNIAHLFGVQRPAITKHLKNIYDSGELLEESTSSILELVGGNGQIYSTRHYNLDIIIAVGYRVNSRKATEFRQWATEVLKQYLINGYAVNKKQILEIKSSIDELANSHKILKKDVFEIKKLLSMMLARPVIIQNHSHHKHKITAKVEISEKLEDKLVKLLDKIIADLSKNKRVRNRLEKVRNEVTTSVRNAKSRKNLISFFAEIGDENSMTYKAIKGAGIAKNIIKEIVKIGEKMKELL